MGGVCGVGESSVAALILRAMHGTTTLDLVTLGLAVYGAAVATGALVVQSLAWLRSWQTRVDLRMNRMNVVTVGTPPLDALVFRVINHSSHGVKITSIGILGSRGGHGLFFAAPLPLGVPGPWPVPARDAITLHQPIDSLAKAEHRRYLRGYVVTSDGKRFRTRRVRRSKLVDD